jgi:uncharacterized protein YciI
MGAGGNLAIARPIDGDDEIAGICVYQAGSVDKAPRLAEDDPAVRAGRFEVRVLSWFTAKGSLVVKYSLAVNYCSPPAPRS